MSILNAKQLKDLVPKSDSVAVVGLGLFKPFRREHPELLSGARIHEAFIGLEKKKVKVVIFPNGVARDKIADFIPKEKFHVLDNHGVLIPASATSM
jgi:hypothetical protein